MNLVPESTIAVTTVAKDFGYQHVLSEIDLTIEQGQFVALMGPNGAGKTTLLRMLAGLTFPTSGTITVAGIDLRNAGPGLRRRMGFVSHESLLYPELTGRENLEFHAQLLGIKNVEDSVRALDHTLNLSNILDRQSSVLSRGNRQRLTLARALLHAPSVLLLDEPFTGLDQLSATKLMTLLRQLVATGRTVVMTTHDQTVANSGPSRLIVLTDGQIVEDRKLERPALTEAQISSQLVVPEFQLPPGRIASALAIAKKDLKVEVRTKDLLSSSGLFALCVLVTTSFTMPPGEAVSGMATGVLWMSILFATILAVGRSMGRESAERGIEALLLSPVPRESIFLGKALGALVVMVFINALSALVFLLVMASGAVSLNIPQLVLTSFLGTSGLVLIATLFSAIAVGSRLGESMLALIVMPVAIPLMIGSVELTRIALGASSEGMLQWVVILTIYDIMVGLVGLATFAYVVEE